jgi:hypothetical protein
VIAAYPFEDPAFMSKRSASNSRFYVGAASGRQTHSVNIDRVPGPVRESKVLRRGSFSSLALALVAAVCSFAPCSAASPADELLRFVSTDVGFCFVARDLRAKGEALADSPFVAGLSKTPVGAAIAKADELAKLAKLQEQLQTQVGLDWKTLREDIFGEAIAFAYRPGPPGKPDEEEGLILIRARAAKPLADLVKRLNEIQTSSGEVKEIEQRSHGGLAYFCRVERDKAPSYYYVRGPILLLSSNEAMLLRALDLERVLAPEVEPSIARELRVLGADHAVLALWINPRAFDAQLGQKARSAAPDAAGLKVFERYWSALDGVAISLALEKDLSLALALRGRPEQLPPAARRLFAEAARPSELWQTFPDPVLIALAGRIDVSTLVEAVSDFLTPDGRPAMTGDLNRALGPPLGKDFVKEVLPCLGPDIGFCIYAPPAGDKGWFPQGFGAVKVSAGDTTAPVDRAVLAGLHSVAIFAVLGHNAKDPDHPLSLKSVTQDKREVKYLTGDGVFPPGLEPAFGLHSGYLVVATSPATLRRFAPRLPATPRPGEATPILRLNLKEWREYLKGHQESLIGMLAEKEGTKPEVVRGRLEAVISTLDLFDLLEINQRTSPGQVALTIRLQTALPLRK